MTSHTTNPDASVSRLEVVAIGARRRWTLEEKLRILAESSSGPRLVSATARRHGLSVNQLFVWRRLLREGRLGGNEMPEQPGLVRALVTGPGRSAGSRIEIVLSQPRRLIVEGEIDVAAVARLADALAQE